MFSQARKYILYTHKPELTTGEKGPIQLIRCRFKPWVQFSENIVFLMLQLDEARRGLGVGASISSPVASHKDSWRSCKNPSVKMVKKKNQKQKILFIEQCVLCVVAVKGITFFLFFLS